MVRGYLLIFMLDDGRMMCRSVIFPECKEPLVGFLINLCMKNSQVVLLIVKYE